MAVPVLHGGDRRAEVARWDPFAELERFEQMVSDLFDTWRPFPKLLGEAFRPLADVEELPDAYQVEVELPGVKREDIEVEVSGRRVSVRGERKERERAGTLRRRERTVGRFAYEVTLPGDVKEDGVEATLADGVLTIRLPKPDGERPRRIEVT